MRGRALLTLAALTIVSQSKGWAFETETHALITRAAYGRSVISAYGPGTVRDVLGLTRLDASAPFRQYWVPDSIAQYYDDGGVTPNAYGSLMSTEEVEQCQMREFLNTSVPAQFQIFFDTVDFSSADALLPIQNWLVRGAIREDDLGPLTATVLTSAHCSFALSSSSWGGIVPRVFNHFYDPVWNTAMPLCPGACNKSVDWALGNVDSFATSPVEDEDRGNHYSYRDARNTMWWALTREAFKVPGQRYTTEERDADARDRLALWATTFRALGDVVHLLEDTGQPQHTRNDPHSSTQTLEQQAFEGYTNARVLGGTLSDANSHVRAFFPSSDDSRQLDPPPLGDYPVVAFTTPTRFYSTRGDDPEILTRAGLADYTNRGFFTGGTLPPDMTYGTPHDYPPQSFTDGEGNLTNGYVEVLAPCEGLLGASTRLTAVSCAHYLHVVPDIVAPNYLDELPIGFEPPDAGEPLRAPLISASIFRTSITTYIQGEPNQQVIDSHRFAIGIEELDNMGNMTIPRAVSYATGMIDFFFRGQLTLSSPPDGLYAVADQGASHDVEGGVPFLSDGSNEAAGFRTVRVRARNTTSDIVESGTGRTVAQLIHGGTDRFGDPTGQLVAIARYHRNPCYQPDLSGEYVVMPNVDGTPGTSEVPSGCAPKDTRTAYPEISVSAPIFLHTNGDLPGRGDSSSACANVGNINTSVTDAGCENDSPLLEFDFSSDPIPMNSTDLFLQVAYRGPLGDEDDGIAVGQKDILEPNYFTIWNNTDYVLYNNAWTPDEQVPTPPGPFEAESVTEAHACFEDQSIAQLNDQQELGVRDFLRIAVLTDIQYLRISSLTKIASDNSLKSVSDGYMLPSQREAATEDIALSGPYAPDAMAFYGRGTVLGFDFGQYYYWYGDPTQDQYIKVLTLSPPLSGAGGQGIASSAKINFTSAPDDICELWFGAGGSMASKRTIIGRDSSGLARGAQ